MRKMRGVNEQAKLRPVKGVIPVFGFGTRSYPLTIALTQALLPLNRRPLIKYSVEESIESGVREIGIVIHKCKEAIQTHLRALMDSSEISWPTLKKEWSGINLKEYPMRWS